MLPSCSSMPDASQAIPYIKCHSINREPSAPVGLLCSLPLKIFSVDSHLLSFTLTANSSLTFFKAQCHSCLSQYPRGILCSPLPSYSKI